MPTTRIIIALFFFSLVSNGAFAQIAGPPNNDAEYEKDYTWRIRQERLFGVYIPKDIPEAVTELIRKMPPEGKKKYTKMPEELVVEKLYFSLGRWITHNWSFYEGSRLAHNFRQQGISYPEDMAAIIMILAHRSLNEQPLHVKELLAAYRQKQVDRVKQREAERTILFESTRKVEPDSTTSRSGH